MKITRTHGTITANWGCDEFERWADAHPACCRGNGLPPTIILAPGAEPVCRLSWWGIPQPDPFGRIEKWAWDLLLAELRNELATPTDKRHEQPS